MLPARFLKGVVRMALGFIFSLIISVLFAAYAIPRKFSKQNAILYVMWMSIAYLIGTILIMSILWGFGFEKAEDLFSPWHLLTVARGIVWVFGMVAFNLAIDKIGLARFSKWKNIQGPVGSLLILFIVADMELGINVLWLFLGMMLMLASALMFQVKSDTITDKNAKMGIALGIFAGFCFGISALINSVMTREEIVGEVFLFAQLLYHSLTLVICSAVLYIALGNKISKGEPNAFRYRFGNLFKVNKKTWLPVIAGTMFLIAAFLTIYSYRLMPNAIAWSITQLNIFWSVIIGVFIFKEICFKTHWWRLTLGILFAFSALTFLFFAM